MSSTCEGEGGESPDAGRASGWPSSARARKWWVRPWGCLSARDDIGAPAAGSGQAVRSGAGDPSVSWVSGVIRLCDRRLIDANHPASCRSFLQRVFRLPEVLSVEIDWDQASADVRFAPEGLSVLEVLSRLAAVCRGEPVAGEGPEVEPPEPAIELRRRVKVFPHDRQLTTWQLASAMPGRLRLRHDALAGDAELAVRLEAELLAAHGVMYVQARPWTAGLLVRFDPKAIPARQVIAILDRLVLETAPSSMAGAISPPVRFGPANSTVGLAALGEFAVPALLPASAVLLLASNIKVIREAGRELRRGQLGLPVLATTVIAATLGTGQFLVAALMGWLIQFWRHRHRQAQVQARYRLLPSWTQRHRYARLCAGAQTVEVAPERLRSGDRILVEEGELVPADGRLIGGPTVVDERLVGGVAGLSRKQAGDPVFAGSTPVSGRLQLEVSEVGAGTRAARLGRELAAAAGPVPAAMAMTLHGERFARRAVAPTLAAAGLGLIVGDVATALAILRADYATGPGLGVSLETLRDIAACAREGIVVRDPSAFSRIAAADVWVLDHHRVLEQVGLEVESLMSGSTAGSTLLRLATTAYRDLADERTTALVAACRSHRLPLFAMAASYDGREVILEHEAGCFSIQDAPACDGPPGIPRPLDVTADGQVLGRITFRPTRRPRAAQAIRELRRQGAPSIGLLSDRPDSEAVALATTLGLDFHQGGLSAEAKADLLRSYRRRGRKVAFIGDGRRAPQAAREAHIAISLSEGFDLEPDPAQVLVIGPDLGAVPKLRHVACSHVDRVRTVHGSILIPNFACVAGALFLGWTGLTTVILTNLGTLAIYSGLPHRAGRGTPWAAGSGLASTGRDQTGGSLP